MSSELRNDPQYYMEITQGIAIVVVIVALIGAAGIALFTAKKPPVKKGSDSSWVFIQCKK